VIPQSTYNHVLGTTVDSDYGQFNDNPSHQHTIEWQEWKRLPVDLLALVYGRMTRTNSAKMTWKRCLQALACYGCVCLGRL